MIHMDQMILSEPSIIIIWTYQDMMGWLSRILVKKMAGADEDYGMEVGQSWFIFLFKPQLLILQLSMISMGLMILSEPSIIIIWTYQDMMKWISRILVGKMADGVDEDFGMEVWLLCSWDPSLIFDPSFAENQPRRTPKTQ
jgi:hypothetical protein